MGKGIINLSGVELAGEEMITLDKGLKFVPPRNISKFQTFIDVHKYTRKLNVKRYFLSKPVSYQPTETSTVVHSGLANVSLFRPPGNISPNIAIFRDLVIKTWKKMRFKKKEVPRDIKDGIEKICKRNDIVIRPADKGGGFGYP